MNKLNLALLPTPLQKLDRLGEFLGIQLWIKRDDLAGDLLTGGNKVRKLEYLLYDAKSQGADTILVAGGLQSNLVKTTAALAIKERMRPVLFLMGEKPEKFRGNLFLDSLLGVEFRFVEASHPSALEEEMSRASEEFQQQGKSPYTVPFGASNGLGALGYIDAYKELEGQRKALKLTFDWEFVSTGSGGTFAGIYVGHEEIQSSSKLVGISPWLSKEEVGRRIQTCVEQARSLRNIRLDHNEYNIDDGFIGEGYGIPSKQGIEAIRLLAQNEGILVDHSYTGKALAGLIKYVRDGIVKPGQTVLFWHTGGAPVLSLLEDQWDSLISNM